MRERVGVVAAAVVAVGATSAAAQSPPSAAPAPAKGKPSAAKPADTRTVQGVTVTGESQNGLRTSIDRRSYGVANDLATTTGSISDALKNIPSVEVDVQGNVSLRGDANVTIMIDGKPSTLFKGPGAAQALQALPADQIERVEVITNPSAQFTPEGSAGIINLITKQSRRAGRSGSVRVNLGTAGRRNVGASAAYNSNKLTLSADAAWRRDPQHSVDTDVRVVIDPLSGRQTTFHNIGQNRGTLQMWNVRVGGDYDSDAVTRISAEARYNDFIFHPSDPQDIRVFDASGAPVQQIKHVGSFQQDRTNAAGNVSYRRKFAGDDHTLAASLNFDHTDEHTGRTYTDFNLLPALPNVFRIRSGRNGLDQTEFKADYNRPMPQSGRLKTGYDYRLEDNEYDNTGVIGTNPADVVPDLTQIDRFRYRLQLNAAYATYEQPFGDWTILGGLRFEDARIDLKELTVGRTARQAYTRVYPSVHLADRLSETQQLVISYSQRVLRPGPLDLNPFVFVGVTTARQGNSDLKPQFTHSFEVGWQFKDGPAFYLATLYYRQNDHGVTDVVSELPGGILLTTKANLSQSRNAGLEFVANGRLTKTLSYNASTNIYWNEIDAPRIPLGPGFGFGARRSAVTEGGRVSLNWQATPKDLFQVNGQVNAERLLPQGYSDPSVLIFLGYRHKVSDDLSFVVTAQDPFKIYRFRQVIDTPTLHEVNVDRGRIQAAFVGLTWTFGAAQKRPQTFDFGQPGGG
ncbi:MAG: TonB-dependent receptor domain-containing protein [Phenylobacterium sp.]